ncbi:MAG: CinA family nicotinamide mononucleotide deamidase-related protein [Planctomycetota bacterium]|nr:CinA family nicotinamide mononucleotide deamidase-related protein [Planctomycetota bacterium]
MQAEVISIGDEIASGQLLDTNSQWLSTRLADMGIRVLYHTTVGDDPQAQADVFRQSIGRADVVVITGGLGPTADDLTRAALADATGRPLQMREEAMRHIRRMFERRQRQMPKRNELQAFFPAGSRIIHNPNGTAPGIDMQIERDGGACRLFALPGVPAEMREMWKGSVLDALRQQGAGQRVIVHKKISCFGAGESQIEAMLPDLIRRGRVPLVGITASQATIILRITAEGDSQAECLAAMGITIKTIHECLGDLVFGSDDDQLQDALLRLLRDRGQTLATAEWGTAGLVTRWLSTAADKNHARDDAFLGGVVAQDEGLTSALDLPAHVLPKNQSDEKAVEELVRQMATACRRRFSADLGLAIGPFPNIALDTVNQKTDAKRPMVMAALATADGVSTQRLPFLIHPALRETFCGKNALNFVRLRLLR